MDVRDRGRCRTYEQPPNTLDRLARASVAWGPRTLTGVSHRLRRSPSPAPWLAVGDAALADYEDDRDLEYTRYLSERAEHYAYETRWLPAPFWSRREGGAAARLRRRARAPDARDALERSISRRRPRPGAVRAHRPRRGGLDCIRVGGVATDDIAAATSAAHRGTTPTSTPIGSEPRDTLTAMRGLTDATKVRRLMRELGRAARGPGRVYVTGGTSAVLVGWRAATHDVDLKLDPEPAGIFDAIPRLKQELDLNIELAAPDDFIPPLPDWQARSVHIEKHGPVEFLHYDFHAQALSKIERGHAQDLADVHEMRARGLVTVERLRALYDAIEPRLVRYPAIDPEAFRRKVEQCLGDRVGG